MDAVLRNKYGVTSAERDALLDQQGGVCAICGAGLCPERGVLAVDHDHDTGEVRGILCQPCNRGLGDFRDSPALLLAAAEYLRKRQLIHIIMGEF